MLEKTYAKCDFRHDLIWQIVHSRPAPLAFPLMHPRSGVVLGLGPLEPEGRGNTLEAMPHAVQLAY